MDNKDLVNKTNSELSEIILAESNPDNLNNVIDIFNYNLKKQELIRTNKLHEILNKLTDQAIDRLENRPNNFSNKDILDYMQAISNILSKQNEIGTKDFPTIKLIQNNNINLTANSNQELSKESRDRILKAVNAILNAPQDNNSDIPETNLIDEENTD